MHHILIIEDEKIVAADIKYMLNKIDMTSADIAPSANAAFSKIKEKKPDLILMDINLSGEIDGVQAAEIILRDYKIPVMYLTAYADENTVERAKHTEPIGYLLKPFNEVELKTNIEIALYKQQISEKLKKQELWLSTTLTQVGLGIIKTDSSDYIILMNNVAENMIGVSLEAAEGIQLSVLAAFLDMKQENTLPLKELASSQRNVFLRNNLGHAVPVSLTVQKEEQDHKVSIVYFLQDISEKLGAEKKIRNTEQLLEQTFQSLHDSLFITRCSFTIMNCNHSGVKLFGYEESDLIDKSIFMLFNNDKNNIEQVNEICKQRSFYKRHEFMLFNKKGEAISTEITLAPLPDEDDENTGWVFTMTDIRERKLYEKRLKEAKETAELANRAKSEFLTNMSHELRTPLNSIIGMTELTLETNLTRDQKEYLEIVHQSSLSFLVLLNSILDFSKIETGKIELEDTMFDVKKVCQEAVEVMNVQAIRKGLELRLEIAHEVPQSVTGDPHRLNQIILNLIGNAVKFTETGYIRLTVSIDQIRDNRISLLFSVEDTGIGIPEDKHESIFESFEQVDGSTTRKYGGTGLGLAISKKLVELMKGKLWVNSKVDQGSVFFFNPEFGLSEEEMPVIQKIIHDYPHQEATSNLKILVAEDDLFTQKIVQRALEKRGNTVFCVENGEAAISLIGKIKFDILLLDIEMPVMNGYETVQRIRKTENHQSMKDLPIIAITAHAQSSDREKCMSMGMNGYLPKPIHIADLVNTINSFKKERPSTTTALKPIVKAVTKTSTEQKSDVLELDFNSNEENDSFLHHLNLIQQTVKNNEHHVLERLADRLLNFARNQKKEGILDDIFMLKIAARDTTMKRAKGIVAKIKKNYENIYLQANK